VYQQIFSGLVLSTTEPVAYSQPVRVDGCLGYIMELVVVSASGTPTVSYPLSMGAEFSQDGVQWSPDGTMNDLNTTPADVAPVRKTKQVVGTTGGLSIYPPAFAYVRFRIRNLDTAVNFCVSAAAGLFNVNN